MRLLLVLFILMASPVMAQPLELRGDFKQGGLVYGKVPAGSQVKLNARDIAVSPQGDFLLGFERLAEKTQTLSVRHLDGQIQTRTLTIEPQSYHIQRIDGLPKNKVSPNPKTVAKIRADNAEVRTTRKSHRAQTDYKAGFIKPVEGRISGVFGSQRILNGNPRSPHKGLDIAAATGTPVAAASDGVISLVDRDMFLMGKTLMIDHGFGLQSIYIHLHKINVEEGMRVQKGQIVAQVGSTGRSTGPHLHWGLSLYETALDPALVLTD